jgi:hypothetical protein
VIMVVVTGNNSDGNDNFEGDACGGDVWWW